ncbi:hypothetical protein [Geothrix oryzisoli]|uniref:hypothetical protein n=1 Tax=Geothrix oryzisoli TaxID=2922721 RepID=UPI001FAD0EB2|nr:hypothetical protein [Geothrix oryzisoli]
MTMLLVLFLIVAFVGTDFVVQAVSRRAKVRREEPQETVTRLNLSAGSAQLQGAEGHRPIHP